MTFLAPVAGIVAATLTVPVVIAFYLLKLRRRPVRVGSVMFWERAVRDAQGNVPWRMVRPQTQLVLQLLGLALLLLAFARPVAPGELGGRVMLVLDRSASMNATDGQAGATRLEDARDRLRELATDLSSTAGTRVMIVALASEALPLTPWTSDRAVLLGALEAVEPTDETASADALVDLVRLAAAGDDAGADEAGDSAALSEATEPTTLAIVLASDGDIEPPSDPLPANVEIRLESVGGVPAGADTSPKSNAGIVAVAAQRLYDDPATVRVFARAEATGDFRRELPIRLALDGRIVAEEVADLTTDDGGDGDDGDEGPSVVSVGLSVASPDAGVLSVLLPGDDALVADDTASLWLRSAGRPRVLHVIPNDEIVHPDRPGPVILVSAVLDAMDLGGLRIVRLGRYEQLAAGGVLPFDVAVFDRVSPSVPPQMASLHLGVAPPSEQPDESLEFVGVEPGELPPTRVVSWRRSHPVMRDLALDQLAVAEPLIDAAPGLVRSRTESAGQIVLASGERSPLIVADESGQHRRIWVGFEPAMSNWPKLVSFPLFIAEAVDYLSLRGARDAADSVRAGDLATMILAQPRTSVRVTGSGRVLETTTPTPSARPTIGPLPRAGVFLLEDANPGDQRAVAVNVASELESRIGVRTELPLAFGGMSPGEASGTRMGGERELWPWFLVAGLLVLTLEWFFSARSLGR
ncbi:MAG: VWA domain-containing protein [Phycisphaerales bacterium]|nr:VWA domain-containing protein [Phycisphaerales bacterium]